MTTDLRFWLNNETGATGLEPATSGVTGHFRGREVNDDGSATALFMQGLGALRVDSAWLREAARDVCCPIDPPRASGSPFDTDCRRFASALLHRCSIPRALASSEIALACREGSTECSRLTATVRVR